MLLPGRPDPVAQAGRIDCRVQRDFRQNGDFVKTAISSKRRFRQNDGIQARFSLDLSAQCVDCRGIAGVLPKD
jgi:hypothetical protein